MSLFLLLLLVLFSCAASAHPGKTDYQDGHKCLKNCEDWDLYYSEYHLHDKDRNAIRVEGKKKSVRQPTPAGKTASEFTGQEVTVHTVLPSPGPQTTDITVTAPKMAIGQEHRMPAAEGCTLSFHEFVLLGVAGLLLFVMLYLRRKRERE